MNILAMNILAMNSEKINDQFALSLVTPDLAKLFFVLNLLNIKLKGAH